MGLPSKFKNFILPKLKFAAASSVATLVDYVLYLVLEAYFFSPVISNIISASVGMVINFFLQKKYIFILNRNVNITFILSISFSILGIVFSTALIGLLTKIPFFYDHQYITKLIVSGIIFFYNFYSKRFAFERKFLGEGFFKKKTKE